jgi:ABC-type antimicrobial peptide transport system permease subunit
VIGGALIVGDSVKASLRQMTLKRLGKIDYALSGPRFVREKLAESLEAVFNGDRTSTNQRLKNISPAIVMQAGLQSKSGESARRAGQVNVYGFDQRAWSLLETGNVQPPEGTNVVLNARAAEAIDAKVGDEITVWIELPSMVPRDTLMGNKDNDSQEITLTVSEIVPETNGLTRLGLLPTQSLPLNAFVNLHLLQERLSLDEAKPSKRDPVGKPARVNALLAESTAATKPLTLIADDIKSAWSLADLNLRLIDNPSFNGIVFESEQMIIEDKLATAAEQTADDMGLTHSPVMVYLTDKIWNPKVIDAEKKLGLSLYSTVAGFDVPEFAGKPFADFQFIGEKPSLWGDDDVILNEFLATDLQVKVGDVIKFTYHSVGSRGELPEKEHTVTVRGIVAMTGTAIDRTLTPEVKGITDVDSLANWDQPYPMDVGAVTSRDDEYWDSYRAIPKMYLPLKTAKTLWPSRYGSLTSLRIGRTGNIAADPDSLKKLREDFATKLLARIKPEEVGLAFQPVKAIGLMAASGSTDFSGLFFGFSLFIIVAAMILIGLLFRLGIEQRVRDLGLLGAVGFNAKQVQRQMLSEGLATTVVGGVLGTVAAVSYAKWMIYGLTHWWIGAIGTKDLVLEVSPPTLFIGFLIAVIAALFSIWWALRHIKRLSLREQLAGVTEQEVDLATQRKRAMRVQRRAMICSILAAILTVAVIVGVIPAAGAFFGIGVLLLVACLSFLSGWLQDEKGIGVRGHGLAALGRLGLRNASRQRQRTVMTAGMIATATFLIVTVAAFRRDPTSELPVKSSGNGGFTLVAESSSPVLYDMNTADGRKKLQLSPPENSPAANALAAAHVVPFRVKPGEDASCLNLYQTKVPTILGAPQSLIGDNRFAFVSGSWKDLLKTVPSTDPKTKTLGPAIPVLGDMNTLMFSLHKQVGQTIAVPNDDAPQHQLVVKGMFQDSIFQGVLVMSEEEFTRLYPEQKGFRYFLIEVPAEHAKALAGYLETELAEYGFDTEPVAERLARFLSVQNTYLSTFQTLGGLGLLLGTFGLATVMLRNVLERQTEFSLLRAIGFHRRGIATLVLWENAFILSWGLVAGAGSAILATAPNVFSRGGGLPWESLAGLLALVFATGMLAALFAVFTAVRLPIVTTLRGE